MTDFTSSEFVTELWFVDGEGPLVTVKSTEMFMPYMPGDLIEIESHIVMVVDRTWIDGGRALKVYVERYTER